MKKPTSAEVDAELERLVKMKPTVRRFTRFGDDHWAAIDAQIKVMTEEMDRDDLYDEDWKENVLDAALEAYDWINGDLEEGKSPSKGWESLVE